jgi:hypothetical protein
VKLRQKITHIARVGDGPDAWWVKIQLCFYGRKPQPLVLLEAIAPVTQKGRK